MCGRYSVGKTSAELAEELEASLATDAITPRFNVAPTQPAPMLVALPDRRLGLARFGWALRNKKGLLLNARSETAPSNGLFQKALERRRALIPADGFYEWRTLGAGKKATKQAYFLHHGGEVITFAGLYYVDKKVDKKVEKKEAEGDASDPAQITKEASFVILTTAASEAVQRVHDRMPVIVPPELRAAWLDTTQPAEPLLRELMARDPELSLREVGSRVGSPANDDPSLQDPV